MDTLKPKPPSLPPLPPTDAELSRRSRVSRGRGRRFEDQIVKRLSSLGYKAQKKLLSGSYLKKPYDIVVQPYRLKIEAKRTLKESIVIHRDWLDRIKPKLIFVLAVGNFAGKMPIEMWVLCDPSEEEAKLLGKAYPEEIGGSPKISIIDVKKSKTVKKQELNENSLVGYRLKNNGQDIGWKGFRIYLLERYMKALYPLTKEPSDATTTN